MPRHRLLAVVLPVSMLVAAGLWAWRQPAESTPASPAAPAMATTPSSPPSAARVATLADTRAQAAPPAASGASAPASLAARIDAWARSDDPHDAMQAYQAIFKCLLARRRAHAADLSPDAPGEDAAALCGDLRSDQVQQPLALLEKAARAGERDAAIDFIQEGPGGNGALQDLATIDPTPPTPDWLARRDDYVERALTHCDIGLAMYLGHFIRQRETRSASATQYWLERVSCPGHSAVNSTPLAEDPQGVANLEALSINGWQQ